MRAASLRIPITIVEPTRVPDDSGGAEYADTTVIDLRARQLSSREAERYSGAQLEGVIRRVYETRYYAGITSSMVALIDGYRFRVIGAEDPDEGRRRRMMLTCERRRGDAG